MIKSNCHSFMDNSISVIIPSRSPQYLQRTVTDLLDKSSGSVEVIVVLDGIWPEPMLKDDKRVRIIHQGEVHNNRGMRAAINAGMALARGEYVCKVDEHIMMAEGWDEALKEDCQDKDVVVPRRYRLDPEKWENISDGRNPIDYMYLTNPFMRPGDKTNGLRGKEWKEKFAERKDVLYDDLMTCQGSFYFMKKAWWDKMFPNGMDEVGYGKFTGEAQEIGNTSWLMGGRMMVNKKTWYSHLWKGKGGKGYGFSRAQYKDHQEHSERGRKFAVNYWLTTKDYERDFTCLMEHFWPVPTWPDDWKEFIIKELKTYPK